MKSLFAFFAVLLITQVTNAQLIDVPTSHQHITMQVKNLGFTADVLIHNAHASTDYNVKYTVEFELKCGGIKTFSKSLYLSAGSTDDCGGYTIAVPDVKNCTRGVKGARLTSFSATEVKKSQPQSPVQVVSNTPASPRPETKPYTSPEAATATERQTRLDALKREQDAAQKSGRDFAAQQEQRYQQSKKEQEALSNTITSGAVEIYNMFEKNAREKREREEKDRQNKLQAEEEAARVKEAFNYKITSRRNIITEFPVRDVPLSSRERSAQIYYFIYAYNTSLFNAQQPTVYISNVFEIGKYKDGTRVYTPVVLNEISGLTPFTEVLHGYYLTRDDADKARESFITLLQGYNVNFTNIDYKGKPGATIATTVTPVATNQSKYGKSISTTTDKFAPAEINMAKPSELPRQSIQKAEESKYGKTIKVD